MFNIYGKYAEAKIFADICESEAQSQIYDLCNHPVYEGAKIRIMPDVHAGAGCTVGTTVAMKRRAVIPSIVGADIGCGVLTVVFKAGKIDFRALEDFIVGNIPSGMSVREKIHPRINMKLKDRIEELTYNLAMYRSLPIFLRSVGTLGGGNHYIEVGLTENGDYVLSVHSGSRALGKCVAKYFQDSAKKYVFDNKITGINRAMPYIEGEDYDNYIRNMLVCADMASENRRLIASDIISHIGGEVKNSFDTVHNYIETHKDGSITVRKGAVSAYKDQLIAVPLNMRDGVAVLRGKSNPDWNFSAPHGAGRLLSRREAKASISLADYEAAMQGINTWSVLKETLDESPMAYKPAEALLSEIEDTAELLYVIKPKYNFKAHTLKKIK